MHTKKTIISRTSKSPKHFKLDANLKILKDKVSLQQEAYMTTNGPEDKQLFFKYKREYEDKLKHHMKEKLHDYISASNNPDKAVWKIINTERNHFNKNCNSNTTLQANDRKFTNPKSIAHTFNSYFINIGKPTTQTPLNINHLQTPPT